MRSRIHQIVLATLLVPALSIACSSGGGGGGSPFPKAVRDLFKQLESELRAGGANLSPTLTCGGPISNPFAEINSSGSDPISGSGTDHAGTVVQADWSLIEMRNVNGSGTTILTIVDTADPSRVFLNGVGTFGKPKIRFLNPPLGAKDFLASNGTGQSFALVKIERKIKWTRDFTNDPVGTGTGTLVDFNGPPVIPFELDGTLDGETREEFTFLIEFAILAGPPLNVACIVNWDQVGEVETVERNGTGITVSPIEHDHDVLAGTIVSPLNALENKHGTIVPVGTDAIPSGPVADGDGIFLANGALLGGVVSFPAARNETQIDDANGAVSITDDGVGNPTDGVLDGVSTYSIDGMLTVNTGPGGVNNMVVEVSVLTLATDQEEDPSNELLDHPILDEFILYGEWSACTESGIIIYR